VDCSHGNSNKDHTRQGIALKDIIEQRVAGNANIIGCMLESNINHGNQSIPADLADLKYGVSVTDACIDWDTTAATLTEMAEKLRDVLPAR